MRFRIGIGYSMCVGITATIITLNEEDRIAGAIASLPVCDEIIVVDSGSTDRTREVAAAMGARVIARPWEGYSKQKNFAAEQARNDWIFSIDADERVSVELSNELAAMAGTGQQIPGQRESGGLSSPAAFSMPRRAYYIGAWIHHSGWYPDRKLRLYDRRRARWEGDFVHEGLAVDGTVAPLRGDLLHLPYRNWNDHVQRIDRYTRLAAEAARKGNRGGSVLKLVFGPPLAFLKAFVFQLGFLDGWRGLAIAYMGARYVFLRQFRILR